MQIAKWKDMVKGAVNQCLKPFDACIINEQYLQHLIETNERGSRAIDDLEFLSQLPKRHTAQLLSTLRDSKSQLRQDLFVLSELDFKTNGFFVEFGATNGVTLSNTHLLETRFGWTGILAEPARGWHDDLKRNRSAQLETKCVWRDSHSTLIFNEVQERELSTIDSFSSSDTHARQRNQGCTYEVKTISLLDLLDNHKAPPRIDYLSIDTEGSEYEILSIFDFDKYQFQIITCEHNFETKREQIHSLLTGKGYIRKYETLSKFDDWYVRAA
jgi:FkbM family methyltransferase